MTTQEQVFRSKMIRAIYGLGLDTEIQMGRCDKWAGHDPHEWKGHGFEVGEDVHVLCIGLPPSPIPWDDL